VLVAYNLCWSDILFDTDMLFLCGVIKLSGHILHDFIEVEQYSLGGCFILVAGNVKQVAREFL